MRADSRLTAKIPAALPPDGSRLLEYQAPGLLRIHLAASRMNMQRVRAAKLPGAEVGEEVEQRSQVLWRRSELLALSVRHSYFIPRQALASLGKLAYFRLFAAKSKQ